MIACSHYQPRTRDGGTCLQGRYNGKPSHGVCRLCIARGENTAEIESSQPTKGLGDIVERLAKPVAKALNLSCLDATNNLRPESPCAKRRDWLNKHTPFKNP